MGPTDGYVMVDAMIALLIVALTMVLSLTIADRAERVTRLAQDAREANTLLRDLMVSGPRSLRAATGTTAGFAWTIETQLTGAEWPIAICRRYVRLRSAASARQYWASTLEACPPVAPA